MLTCVIVDCGKRARRGSKICSMHCARLARHGDFETVKGTEGQYVRGLTAIERFVIKVNGDGPIPAHKPELGPCWVWTANHTAKPPKGYGRFWIAKQGILAHRWSYEHFVGLIPAGLKIDHLCRNRSCVRPTHLEPVTSRVNCLRGEAPAARMAKRTCCDRCGGELRYTTVHRGKRSGTVTKVVKIRYCPECNRRWAAARAKAPAA